MRKLKIKTGDTVRVIAGDHKGSEGKVLSVFSDKNKAIVEGVNMMKKHMKPNAQNPQGGIVEKEAAIQISNLSLFNSKGESTRVGYKIEDGKKVRFTKKSNEVIAHSYSHLFGLPCTGLRFFTVYGPWGRPDMAPMIFTKSILAKKPIKIFNFGNMTRDFTYIDDVIEILMRLINKPAKKNNNFDFSNPISCSSWAPYKIFNISNNNPIKLIDFIKENELNTSNKIKKSNEFKPGDKIEITEGVFKNCVAIFKCFKSDERVILLMNLMGQQQTISAKKKSLIRL